MRELIILEGDRRREGEALVIHTMIGINPAAVAMFEFVPAQHGRAAGVWFRLIGSEQKMLLHGREAEQFYQIMKGEASK